MVVRLTLRIDARSGSGGSRRLGNRPSKTASSSASVVCSVSVPCPIGSSWVEFSTVIGESVCCACHTDYKYLPRHGEPAKQSM